MAFVVVVVHKGGRVVSVAQIHGIGDLHVVRESGMRKRLAVAAFSERESK